MLQLLILVGRALALGLRGHRELVLENLALRQQLMAMKRANSHPRLKARDRLFWIVWFANIPTAGQIPLPTFRGLNDVWPCATLNDSIALRVETQNSNRPSTRGSN